MVSPVKPWIPLDLAYPEPRFFKPWRRLWCDNRAMWTAALWGLAGGSSLVLGALLGLYAPLRKQWVALIMALGAGVLVSSVAFELMDQAFGEGGFDAASIGLLLGALAFFLGDLAINRAGGNTANAAPVNRRMVRRPPSCWVP